MSDRFLDVLVDGVIVGQLHDTNPLSFVYDLDCINGLRSSLFSSMIPVVTGVINNPGVTSFFENLLPEGDERSLIESRHHVSTIFGLLSKVGMDAAGSVVIIPHGEIDSKKEYMPVTWAELKQILDGSGDAGLISGATSNVSAISGAQSKMLIAIDDHGNPLIPKGGAISTHILKH
jgi:serine/threonine-protein kinase HipA